MARGFLPSRDADLRDWAENFYSIANVAPTSYGLTSAMLTSFNALLTTYKTCLAACDPNARNKTSVLAKNDARDSLITSARLLAKLVAGTATVTNAQKSSLGLNVRAAPTPIPPPGFAPQTDIVSCVGHKVKVRLHNSEAGPKRGKPANVKGAAIFSYVGETAPTNPAAYKFEGNTTLTVVDVTFPETVAPGSSVWIIAMWFNERAESGPPSTPVQAIIQYGMSMAG